MLGAEGFEPTTPCTYGNSSPLQINKLHFPGSVYDVQFVFLTWYNSFLNQFVVSENKSDVLDLKKQKVTILEKAIVIIQCLRLLDGRGESFGRLHM